MDTLARMLRTMRSSFSAMAGPGSGRWQEHDGVGTLVTPDVPQRSVMNCVICQPGADLESVYEGVEARFAAADAWTVWVPDVEHERAAFLEARGHKLDADPAMMVLDLASFEPPSELPDWRPAALEELARINDAAYPWQDGSMEKAIRGSAYGDGRVRLYIAEDACVLGIDDCEGDAGVIFVATLPEARGRGLAGGLLAAALVEARERGCDISTLQATKVGEPVYARLGYQRLGAIQMWEKRKA
jgi:GNAT superfamily N-acetyltransferase